MRTNFILLLLFICQTLVFAQDKKIMKIAKYIEKGKGIEAKELLDELDSKKEYQSDIYYWYVRTVYYRNIALAHSNSTSELEEARRSFEKLVEFDKTDPLKYLTQYIPELRKDLFEGKNKINSIENNKKSNTPNPVTENGKTLISLTEIGHGKTKDEAKYNALRNAIEKAFGTFISSNTTILNEKLIKDEIVSVSNGNIQNFEILSETTMPDGSFTSVLKATVSIEKLIGFCENKGITVLFKGNLFAANIKMIELYTKNECLLHNNLMEIFKKLITKGFDYSISASDPIKNDYNTKLWRIPIIVKARPNSNILNFFPLYESTIKNICLTQTEIDYYKSHKIELYEVTFNGNKYTLRTGLTAANMQEIIGHYIPKYSLNFKINNGITEKRGNDLISSHYQNSGYWLEHYYTFNTSFIKDIPYSFNEDMSLSDLEKITGYSIKPYSYFDPSDDTFSKCD